MKLVLLVDHDFASLLALNYLSPMLDRFEHAIFYTQKSAPAKAASQPLQALAKFNRRAIADTQLSSFAELGAKLNNDVNKEGFDRVCGERPDLIISIRHMTILQPPLIQSARYGAINLHSGRLPEYQGVMATFWAMRDGQSEIGTTLHRIENATIDTGAIIQQSQTRVDYTKSYQWNVLQLYKQGCENIMAAVQNLAAGEELMSCPQQGTANYYSYPTKAEIEATEFALFAEQDLAISCH